MDEKGSISIIFVMFLCVMLALVGFSTDILRALHIRDHMLDIAYSMRDNRLDLQQEIWSDPNPEQKAEECLIMLAQLHGLDASNVVIKWNETLHTHRERRMNNDIILVYQYQTLLLGVFGISEFPIKVTVNNWANRTDYTATQWLPGLPYEL